MLCSTLVFNESVSQLSSPILNIIKYVNKQKKFITEENFIIMLLMNKVTHFGKIYIMIFFFFFLKKKKKKKKKVEKYKNQS